MDEIFSIIRKYEDYFHDGSIFSIQSHQNNLVILMESAQLPFNLKRNNKFIETSERNTISGKLHLINILKIKIDGTICDGLPKMISDECTIYSLKINGRIVNFSLAREEINAESVTISDLELEAENIYWENSPTLFDHLA